MEKNIIVVVREGLALRNDNGNVTTFNSVSSVESTLMAVKSTLERVQTNAQGLEQQFTHLYVPSLLGGLLQNLVGLYKRTGKTREGNVINQSEMNLYIEVDQMLRDRSDNVRLVNLKHIRKGDLNMESLIKKTWALLDREERKLLTQARAGVAPQVVAQNTTQPSPEMLAMQQQMQMMQQMMQGFMSMMSGQMPQMPNMPQMTPVAPVTTEVQPQVETVTTTAPVGTSINIDPNAIANATAMLNTQENVAPTTASEVTEYDPEF